MRYYFRAITFSVPMLLLGGCLLSGCSLGYADSGSLFLSFGTEIEIGHRTSTTGSTATIDLRSQPFEDWLASKHGPSSPAAPEDEYVEDTSLPPAE